MASKGQNIAMATEREGKRQSLESGQVELGSYTPMSNNQGALKHTIPQFAVDTLGIDCEDDTTVILDTERERIIIDV